MGRIIWKSAFTYTDFIWLEVHHGYQWNLYRTIFIICGHFLLRSGRFLQPGQEHGTLKFKELLQITAEAATGICASVPFFLSNSDIRSHQQLPHVAHRSVKTLHFLLLVWPLYVAVHAPDIPELQREWIRTTLFDIGVQGCIPKASALVRFHVAWSFRR